MSPAGRSIVVFGIYVSAIGIGFFFVPNIVLPILGLPLSADFWVRITGVVACVIGYYYLVSARAELTTFFRASTYARTGVCVAVSLLVLTNSAPFALLLSASSISLALRGPTSRYAELQSRLCQQGDAALTKACLLLGGELVESNDIACLFGALYYNGKTCHHHLSGNDGPSRPPPCSRSRWPFHRDSRRDSFSGIESVLL